MVLRLIAIIALLLTGIRVFAEDGGSPRDLLAAHLAALSSIKSLQTQFICEKRIAALEEPLVSGGTITIARPERLRFSTLHPYTSEIILDHGTLLLKSQHETKWTRTTNVTRPGLSAIMEQLTAWSLGDHAKLDETYEISQGTEIVPQPPTNNSATQPAEIKVHTLAMFVLKPIPPDVAKVIRSLMLGIDPTTHCLMFLQITTVDQDVTRYWFYDIKTNIPLSAITFSTPGVAHE